MKKLLIASSIALLLTQSVFAKEEVSEKTRFESLSKASLR